MTEDSRDSGVLLCILIPTFRRNELLLTLLKAYLPVIRENGDVVIIVSNNDPYSTAAREIVEGCDCEQIRFIQQPVNLGAIIHIAWLVGVSTGLFTWIHGDDDSMSPGDLQRVIEAVRRGRQNAYFYVPLSSVDFKAGRSNKRENWENGLDLYIDRFPASTLITSGIYRSVPLQLTMSSLSSFSSYFVIPLAVGASNSGGGALISEVGIQQGMDFSIKCVATRREIFYRQMYCDILDNKTMGYWKKNRLFINAFAHYGPFRTVTFRILLHAPVVLFRIAFLFPLAMAYSLPFQIGGLFLKSFEIFLGTPRKNGKDKDLIGNAPGV